MKVYKNRIDYLNSKIEAQEDCEDIDTKDPIIQLPWQPVAEPTSEEIKKR